MEKYAVQRSRFPALTRTPLHILTTVFFHEMQAFSCIPYIHWERLLNKRCRGESLERTGILNEKESIPPI